tara:strand:+ start:716 stop:865 length:150 start_codon:yes stop_codon:yes gene_type:complete
MDVRIHRKGWEAKSLAHYYGGGFMTYGRKGFQGRKTLWYLAVMFFNNNL